MRYGVESIYQAMTLVPLSIIYLFGMCSYIMCIYSLLFFPIHRCEEQVNALNVIFATSTPQPLCLLIIKVHVPRSASCNEHPACQHQCLLRPHHPVLQQCFCLGQICCIKLWSESLRNTIFPQIVTSHTQLQRAPGLY